jgi:small subunit ribosomal protein S24e
MEIEVKAKRENPLLGRTEVEFLLLHDGVGTPRREEVRDALGRALGVPKDAVVVDWVDSEFGRGRSKGFAKVYESVEAARGVEPRHILVRNRLAEKEEAAKPAAAPAPPAPAKKTDRGGKKPGG